MSLLARSARVPNGWVLPRHGRQPLSQVGRLDNVERYGPFDRSAGVLMAISRVTDGIRHVPRRAFRDVHDPVQTEDAVT